uniref:PD-(D/E)XK nuclease family transposase n=2 Tax=uncultured Parabacteroides sp. TaxID=512312 RepID=UPI002666BC25
NEIYLEMPKFVLPLHECDTLYKKWLYVLNNIEIMERLPKELNNQIFRKLKSIVEVERMTPDQRLEYELSLSVERDLSAALDTSFEDGMEKGLKEGIEKGKAEGLCQVAANLKRMGMDIATIVNSTGLSKEVILSL